MTLPAAKMTSTTAHGGTVMMGCPTVLVGSMPAARLGDNHVCPMVTGVVPHVGGPVTLGAFNVLIGGQPAARQTDMAICVGPPDTVLVGVPTVLIGMAGMAGMMGMLKGLAMAAMMLLKNIVADRGPTAVLQPDGTYVTEYSDGVKIKGTPEFQAKVVRDLDTIKGAPSGKKLLDSIGESGKTVTIVETNKGNACGYSDPADRFVKADGKPGKGSDSTVHYNTEKTRIGDGSEDWMERPPAVGLGHEMVHADHAAHGTQPKGETGGVRNRELQAVGLPPHDKAETSENTLRSDLGEPPRTFY